MDEKERAKRIDETALKLLRLARSALIIKLRFLDAALSRLKPVPWQTLATDGRGLGYNAAELLSEYKTEREAPVRNYLHIVFHCVFRHMFVGAVDPLRWDLACDIAVENIINELNISAANARRMRLQHGVTGELKDKLGNLTAEKLYRHLCDSGLSEAELMELSALFCADDHAVWYLPPEQQLLPPGAGSGSGDDGDGEEDEIYILGSEEDWKKVSERMAIDIETFSKKFGTAAGNLKMNLASVNREKYDYTSFLKKFAVRGEVMKLNDDEFDYIYYTFGLEQYGKMPLIEPLEYKEVRRIRDFVIAIDTSGSTFLCELAKKFVQKTYNIMLSTESFFSRINVHIIQCDAKIREHVKITNQEEFEQYIQRMQLLGGGGTDFRPVFRFVDELVERKEFSNLKGLIYFTDGYGVYPGKKPAYESAFVFVDEKYDAPNPSVPPWAIKLVLQPEEI